MKPQIFRTLAAAALLGCATAASATDFRYVCNDNPTVSCNPRTVAGSAAIALDIAINGNAQVGDSIMIIKNGASGTVTTQVVREFSVLTAPVTSTAQLQDWGWWSDTYDGAWPPPPSLRGDGITTWFAWYIGFQLLYRY